MMKKIGAALLIISLIVTSITGCFGKSPKVTTYDEMNERYDLEYEKLLEVMRNADSLKDVHEYLITWSENHNFIIYYDTAGNFVISGPAPSGFEEASSTAFHCSLTLNEPEAKAKSIATALFVIANAENHGSLKLLLTANEEGDMQGAKKIHDKYITAGRLINLNNTSEKTISNANAGISEYILTKNITWEAPVCSRAYEITIDGLNPVGLGFAEGENLTPNVIKALGDVIAGSKSAGILFELAAFNGGSSADNPPTVATVTILVNDNDVGRFTKRVTSEREKFLDKNSKTHPDLTYTFTEIELPDKVVSAEDCTSMVGLLYTMFNGVYVRSEEGAVFAASNLGLISTHTGNFIAEVSARSLSSETSEELSTTLETICGLSDITYAAKEISPVLMCDEESSLTDEISALLTANLGNNITVKNHLTENEWAILKERNPRLEIVSICGSGGKSFNVAKALLEFLNSAI